MSWMVAYRQRESCQCGKERHNFWDLVVLIELSLGREESLMGRQMREGLAKFTLRCILKRRRCSHLQDPLATCGTYKLSTTT